MTANKAEGDREPLTGLEIRRLGPGDEQLVHDAATLFDNPPDQAATERFLRSPGHHIFLAHVDGTPAGMVTGIEMTHPDKGTEMFLYELSVDEAWRNRGIGRALVGALRDLARRLGCYDMWVLTDDDNLPAVATYQAAGGARDELTRLLLWTFDAD